MMKKIYVSPSILSADFYKLGEEISSIEFAGAEFMHFDVMDGHFVDNISFGIPVLKSISNTHHMVNDVHIMISEPLRYASRFVDAGADILTFHLEALNNEEEVLKIISIIHEKGAKAGISIKPNTKVEELDRYLYKVDLVLIMSVEPGFGGQKFMESALDKIAYLDKYKKEHSLSYLIEVDGGINDITAKKCIEVGVDVLVAGSYVFKAKNYKEAIDSLRG